MSHCRHDWRRDDATTKQCFICGQYAPVEADK